MKRRIDSKKIKITKKTLESLKGKIIKLVNEFEEKYNFIDPIWIKNGRGSKLSNDGKPFAYSNLLETALQELSGIDDDIDEGVEIIEEDYSDDYELPEDFDNEGKRISEFKTKEGKRVIVEVRFADE